MNKVNMRERILFNRLAASSNERLGNRYHVHGDIDINNL